MATSILSLFGNEVDPFAQQQQAFQQRLSQATDPRAFIATVGSNLGGQLGGIASNLLGGPSREQKIQKIYQAVGNISDPLGQAQEAYRLFQQEGMPKEAQMVLESIRELQKERDVQTRELAQQRAESQFRDYMSSPETAFETPEDYFKAARAAFAAGKDGSSYLSAGKTLAKNLAEQKKRTSIVQARAAGITRNNPDMPAEVVPLVAEDDDLFKEWGKTLFEAKKNNYDVSYQTYDGQRVMVVTDKDTATLVKEVPLGKAAETGTKVEVNTGDMETAAEKAKGKVLGEEIGKELQTIRLGAETANEKLPKMYEALDILKTRDINTGLGASLYDILDQVKQQYLNDKKAGKKVDDQQYLDSLIGSDVFNAIADLGIGARGIDTPAEKNFLLEVVTGQRTLSRNALIGITELRIKATEENVKKFNKRLKLGDYRDTEKILGRKLNPIELRNANRAPTVSNWE